MRPGRQIDLGIVRGPDPGILSQTRIVERNYFGTIKTDVAGVVPATRIQMVTTHVDAIGAGIGNVDCVIELRSAISPCLVTS